MSLNLSKTSSETNVSIDFLKLVEKTADATLSAVNSSFYTNGALSESSAIRNMNLIRGHMAALKNMINSIE